MRTTRLVLLLTLAGAAQAQRVDLTGYWRDDAGGNYQIRQVGTSVFWINDGRPQYINALSGTLDGATLRGSWMDLPGGASNGSGSLVLRIESGDRIVKVSQTGSPYAGGVFTRVSGAGQTGGTGPISGGGAGSSGAGAVSGVPAAASAVVGTWSWFTGPQVLIYPDGTFRQDSTAPDALTGKWQLTNAAQRLFTLEWSHGYTDRLTLSADGSRLTTGERILGTRVSSAPPPPLSTKPVIGTWSWFTGGPVWVYADGTFRQPQTNLSGNWRLLDPVRRLYELRWSHGYRDELILSPDGLTWANTQKVFGTKISDVPGVGGGSGGGAPGGDVCANPATLPIMDEWLARAIPPAPNNEWHYEAWGRIVGTASRGIITAVSPPDTTLDRCHWLWRYAATMGSSNGMGTLEQYVKQRLGP